MPRRKKQSSGGGVNAMRARGRKTKLSAVSTDQLQAELVRRERAAEALVSTRDRLLAELDSIESELAQHGFSSGVRPRAKSGRPRRAMGGGRGRGRRGGGSGGKSLVDSLHAVLQGQTMGVSEVAGAVQRAGYKTSSPNFRTIVNAALLGNTNLFKKVARGQYTTK